MTHRDSSRLKTGIFHSTCAVRTNIQFCIKQHRAPEASRNVELNGVTYKTKDFFSHITHLSLMGALIMHVLISCEIASQSSLQFYSDVVVTLISRPRQGETFQKYIPRDCIEDNQFRGLLDTLLY